jgi:hypothetical protein
MKGFIAYEGPSLIDGSPIIGVVTVDSMNPKTGNMSQLWILRSDLSPVDAVRRRADVSVCGSCAHRHNNNGSCYVQPFQAPLSVFKAFKRGNYSNDTARGSLFLESKGIRLGAYGDPAALPDHVLEFLTKSARFHTGYTHQWKNKKLRHALKYCQASVDSLADVERLQAIAPTAKYFRVTADDIRTNNEIECLAISKKITCIECKLCDGKKQNIVINVHGRRANKFTKTISIKDLS